jgi:hypothetical protein
MNRIGGRVPNTYGAYTPVPRVPLAAPLSVVRSSPDPRVWLAVAAAGVAAYLVWQLLNQQQAKQPNPIDRLDAEEPEEFTVPFPGIYTYEKVRTVTEEYLQQPWMNNASRSVVRNTVNIYSIAWEGGYRYGESGANFQQRVRQAGFVIYDQNRDVMMTDLLQESVVVTTDTENRTKIRTETQEIGEVEGEAELDMTGGAPAYGQRIAPPVPLEEEPIVEPIPEVVPLSNPNNPAETAVSAPAKRRPAEVQPRPARVPGEPQPLSRPVPPARTEPKAPPLAPPVPQASVPLQPDGTVAPAAAPPITPTPPGTTFLSDGTALPANGPRPTPVGMSNELGKQEKKQESLIQSAGTQQDSLDDLVDAANLIQSLLEALSGSNGYTYDPGGYALSPVCDRGPNGELAPTMVAEWDGGEGELAEIRARLDALAQLFQFSKMLRQPICRSPKVGQEVTVNFVEQQEA